MSKEKVRKTNVRRREEIEAIRLNGFEVYGMVGDVGFFVDYREAKNFWISTKRDWFTDKEYKFKVDEPIRKGGIFYVNGQAYQLGRPTLNYSLFLKRKQVIDLDETIILDPFVFDISTMSKEIFDEEKIIKDERKTLILIGKSLANSILKDGSFIATGIINKVGREKIYEETYEEDGEEIHTETEALVAESIDGDRYVLFKSSRSDVRFD